MPVGNPTSTALIRRWRERRRAILRTLPPELFVEYRNLGISIKCARAEEARIVEERKIERQGTTQSQQPAPIDEGFFPPAQRVPLSVQKQKLIDFLRERGEPCTRGEITAKTGIPAGSLSELLGGEEFEQRQRGFWALKGK